jgi:hypothetical protein
MPYGAGKSSLKLGTNHCGEEGAERKETPEEMSRALKGVFCKGRYRSWRFVPGKRRPYWGSGAEEID